MPSQPFLGQVMPVPYNFAPSGWAFCNGQILSIAQNTALFSLLGTMYGGDGQTTFALPNLQGSVAIGAGQGSGLSSYDPGDTGGDASVTLDLSQLAAHTHGAMAFGRAGDSASPAGADWAKTANDSPYSSSAPNGTMSALVDHVRRQRAIPREPPTLPGAELRDRAERDLPAEKLGSFTWSVHGRCAARSPEGRKPRTDPMRRLRVVPRMAQGGRRFDRADDLPGGQGGDDRVGWPSGDSAVPRLPQAHGPGRRRPADAPGHAASPHRAGQ